MTSMHAVAGSGRRWRKAAASGSKVPAERRRIGCARLPAANTHLQLDQLHELVI